MRGNPVSAWIIFALLWMALAYPLVQVVSESDHETVAEAAEAIEGTERETWVRVRFSGPPDSFSISIDEAILWEVTSPGGVDFEEAVPFVFEEGAVQFKLDAHVRDGWTAIEVSLAPDGLSEQSETIWADGDISRVVEMSWGVADE